MRVYMADRYERRKAMALEYLGGKCVVCGSTEGLEFDHVDRAAKSFTICTKLAGVALTTLMAELGKCQLLCKAHHVEKCRSDGSYEGNERTYHCCGRVFVGRQYAGHRRWCKQHNVSLVQW